MDKRFMLAEVKSVDGKVAGGEFEAVLSAPTLDRDGEIIESGAFEPLPESIPVLAYHDFRDPIGRGVPYYEDGVLKLRGTFASTSRAQEIRTLVTEGVIGSMSVGFMGAAKTEGDDGIPRIVKAEILEGSFVSIPSNREAAVLLAKSYADTVEGVLLESESCTCKNSDDESDESPDTDPEDEAGASPDDESGDAPADPPADVDEDEHLRLRAQALALQSHL